jgi:hypothetical protein
MKKERVSGAPESADPMILLTDKDLSETDDSNHGFNRL